MNTTIKKLEAYQSDSPSHWREEAEYRRENKSWMRYSQRIAMAILDKMEQSHLTQKALAERMGCSQQYVSKILKGRENLSIETLAKIENALSMQLLSTKIVRSRRKTDWEGGKTTFPSRFGRWGCAEKRGLLAISRLLIKMHLKDL